MTAKINLPAPYLNRRVVFGGLLATTAMVGAGLALRPQSAFAAKLRFKPLASLAAPKVQTAVFTNPPNIVPGLDGSYTLNIQERVINLGGQSLVLQTYTDGNNPSDAGQPLSPLNRPTVGPTITLIGNGYPAQNVAINLQNNLPILPQSHHGVHGPGGTNENPHGFNVTNLHTHGLHVSPAQDNVYVVLCPTGTASCTQESMRPKLSDPAIICSGQYTYQYSFGTTPTGTTQLPAGTYWYHPHKHGSVGYQVSNGMAGAIIVKGDLDEIPNIAGLTEQVMVAQQIQYTQPAPAAPTPSVNAGYFYGTTQQPSNVTLNQQISLSGQINPTVMMQFGEIQRWRFINATDCAFFYLAVVPLNGATAPPPVLYAIATDGIALTNNPAIMTVPYQLGTPYSTPTSVANSIMNEIAVMAPAQRLDLLVQMPAVTSPTPQSYALMAMPYPNGSGTGQTIATIQVAGSKTPADALPASSAFNAGALYRPPITLPTIPNPPVTRPIDFSFVPNNNSTVNLTQFDAQNTQLNLTLGATDVWGVTGYSAQHAFHIHINSFVMYQRDDNVIGPAMIWRDTARIDPSDGNGPTSLPTPSWLPPTVYFVSQQVDYIGEFVLHCHVLQHEDTGMMWSVAINPPS